MTFNNSARLTLSRITTITIEIIGPRMIKLEVVKSNIANYCVEKPNLLRVVAPAIFLFSNYIT